MSKVDHHYTECGLTNVFIAGIEVQVDDDGDEVITIPAVNELHMVIADGIVRHEKGITGEELRFLRTEMGLTQAELAGFVNRDKQSVGRWERGEVEIDSLAETMIRRLAIEKLGLTNAGIEELSRRSVPTAEPQPIQISKVNDNDRTYELIAA
ncbi:helix-turn-helix domain-containing protein [Rhizobium sp. CFBP 13726]|uniref:helix-turn-helix domain-containing protein n=1 Tax=Rhizobium sp. CFBP 13726 TaxID=2775296 RepID=UPI001784840E|nr:helix-turn-helix domain-containing protein [Rhizobium sp. CFBP 13726]MBD8651461.1 helix-turn-helix domain-containing protein [Rhizobium sp. CFBP 13726]